MKPNETKPVERLSYTVNEAVATTGLSRTTLYRMIKDKQLPDVVVHGRRLFSAIALRRLVEGGAPPLLSIPTPVPAGKTGPIAP